MSIDDERSAATKAQEVLNSLTLSTLWTEKLVSSLRHAARVATDSSKGFSSQAALDNIRGEATTALNGLVGSWDKGQLSQAMVDHAKTAIAAWLKALEAA